MIITAEHEINFDRVMEYVGEEIERIITEDECIEWDSITDVSKKELYKKIADYMIINWT